MTERWLADAILIFHAAFIFFAIFGGLLTYRNGQWKKPWLILHLCCATWAATVVIMGWTCPLTPLEQQLRIAAGQQGYSASFIEHYLLAVIYPDGLTRPIQIAMGVGVVLINAFIYGIFITKCRISQKKNKRKQLSKIEQIDLPIFTEITAPNQTLPL